MEKVAIITGGSSGVGAAACRMLADNGFVVYEFSRSGTDRPGVSHITADAREEASLIAGVERVISEAGRLDLLVNNAGFGISGAAEFIGLDQAQGQMAVNFLAMASMCRLALPHLRQSRGCVVNISSVAGELPIPFQSFYSASKAAVDAFTLALANEVRPFGVRVCALLPGDVATGFTAARQKAAETHDLYSPASGRAIATMEKDEEQGMSPDQVARAILKAASQPHPRPLIVVGGKYRLFMALGKFLPRRLSNWIVGKMYG